MKIRSRNYGRSYDRIYRHFVGCMLFLLISVFWIIPCSASVQYVIEPNERILFVGHMNTMLGSAMSHGYVNIFQQEVSTLVKNVTVFNGAMAEASNLDLLRNLHDTLLNHYKPTMVIVALGIEAFAERNSYESLSEIRYEVESIVSRLLELSHPQLKVILFPLALHGEKVDSTNEMDELLEEYTMINKRIARDYNIMLVETSMARAKYLEATNIDNLPHSLLTLEGSVFNAQGHMFTALALLKQLGIKEHSLVADNPVMREVQRALQLRQEMHRLEQLDPLSVNMDSVLVQ
mmetsp:Transcript_7970/g.13227  ORF Transcript_7970/g.13227 Transcript_7970/m.13227 type:complete len:291 (-) Transcript_7970:128-1000(-)